MRENTSWISRRGGWFPLTYISQHRGGCGDLEEVFQKSIRVRSRGSVFEREDESFAGWSSSRLISWTMNEPLLVSFFPVAHLGRIVANPEKSDTASLCCPDSPWCMYCSRRKRSVITWSWCVVVVGVVSSCWRWYCLQMRSILSLEKVDLLCVLFLYYCVIS